MKSKNVLGILLFALLLMSPLVMAMRTESITVKDSEGFPVDIEVTQRKATFWDMFKMPFAISTEKYNYFLGERGKIHVEKQLSFFPDDPDREEWSPLKMRFHIINDAGSKIKSWDTGSELNYLTSNGGFILLDVTFTAPTLPGEYDLKASYINDDTNTVVDSDFTSFAVAEIVTDCPAETCTDWELLDTIEGGKIYTRDCVSYEMVAGECVSDADNERKWECFDGYEETKDGCLEVESDISSEDGCPDDKPFELNGKCYECIEGQDCAWKNEQINYEGAYICSKNYECVCYAGECSGESSSTSESSTTVTQETVSNNENQECSKDYTIKCEDGSTLVVNECVGGVYSAYTGLKCPDGTLGKQQKSFFLLDWYDNEPILFWSFVGGLVLLIGIIIYYNKKRKKGGRK